MTKEMHDLSLPDLLTAEFEDLGDGTSILRLIGEVDISSAHVLTKQFEITAERRLAHVIIDTTGISFMDSTGLHALVEGKRLIHGVGTHIVLVPSRQVRRVLELVFPDPLFAARVDSMDEALKSVGQLTGKDNPT